MDEAKEQEQKEYEDYVKQKTPVHNLPLNMIKAFITGGIICIIGQGVLNYCDKLGIDKDAASGWCAMILVLLSAVLTGCIRGLPNGEAQARWFQLRDLPIQLRRLRLSTRRKGRLWESDARYLP